MMVLKSCLVRLLATALNVFSSTTSITKQLLHKHLKNAAEKIGLPELRFHDLRHTYAVAAIRAGDDIKTVSENLGHASVAFTLDVYGHVTEEMKRSSAERMQNFIDNLDIK